jgi:predicted aspartyl protease
MRPIYHMTDSPPKETEMGKVLVSLTVINRADQVRAEDETIAPEKVRSADLIDVLVDTGATTLCLPADVIKKLGLRLLKEVDVMTVLGIGKARIFRDATLLICGREGTFECLELPEGGSALLGVIPLEMLGLEPDLQSQTLRVLPSETVNTYLTIL